MSGLIEGQRQARAIRAGRFQACVDLLSPLPVDPETERREARGIHGASALGQLPLAQQRDVKRGFGHIAAQTRRARLTHAAILLAPASCPTAARSWAGAPRRHTLVHPGSPLPTRYAVAGPPTPSGLRAPRPGERGASSDQPARAAPERVQARPTPAPRPK